MTRVISDFDRLRAQDMAQELRDILETAFPKDPNDAKGDLAKAGEIRKDLEGMGFMVTWSGKLNLETLKFSVELTLWLPKPGSETMS